MEKCKYCDITADNGKYKRGQQLTDMNGLTAYIWGSKTIEIETGQDDVFAFAHIKYCPMCGREL